MVVRREHDGSHDDDDDSHNIIVVVIIIVRIKIIMNKYLYMYNILYKLYVIIFVSLLQ